RGPRPRPCGAPLVAGAGLVADGRLGSGYRDAAGGRGVDEVLVLGARAATGSGRAPPAAAGAVRPGHAVRARAAVRPRGAVRARAAAGAGRACRARAAARAAARVTGRAGRRSARRAAGPGDQGATEREDQGEFHEVGTHVRKSFHSQKPWWQVLPPVQEPVPVPVQAWHWEGVELVTAASKAQPQGSVLSVASDRMSPALVRFTFNAQSGIVPA